MCRYRNEMVLPPQSSNQFVLDKLLFAFSMALGLSILLIATMITNTCCLRMVDRSMVCGITPSSANNENCNISGFCTTHTHCGKCLNPGVSRNVIFCPLISTMYAPMCWVIPLPLLRYIGLADCIQKGGFTAIDMTHNAYNRRTGYHVLLILLPLSFKFSMTSTLTSFSQSTSNSIAISSACS